MDVDRVPRADRRGLQAGIAVVVLVLGHPAGVRAQELQVTGPLRGASGMLPRPLWREGRFALSPVGGVAITDGGSAALAGAEALFHPIDEVGIGAWTVAALGPPTATGAGELRSVVAPELVVVPIEGRSATLFDSVWLPPYDVHLDLGAAWVARGEGGEGPARPMLGVGFTSFFATFMSFGVDYRVVGEGTWQIVTASLTYWPGERRNDGDEP